MWGQVKFMKLNIMQFSSISYYYQPLKCKNWSALFQNPAYSLFSMHKVSHPQLWKYWVNTHTHVYSSIVMLSECMKESKTLWSSIGYYTKLISSPFPDSAILIPYCHSKIIQVPHPSKISNNVSARSSPF
jgi:hypothetical protein